MQTLATPRFWLVLRGRWRLLNGRCPACNSCDAMCRVCHCLPVHFAKWDWRWQRWLRLLTIQQQTKQACLCHTLTR